MGKLTALIEAAKAAQEEITNPQGRLHYHSTEFYNLANPATILELCALLEKAETALKCVKVYVPPSFANTHKECNETLAAIKQFKEQT